MRRSFIFCFEASESPKSQSIDNLQLSRRPMPNAREDFIGDANSRGRAHSSNNFLTSEKGLRCCSRTSAKSIHSKLLEDKQDHQIGNNNKTCAITKEYFACRFKVPKLNYKRTVKLHHRVLNHAGNMNVNQIQSQRHTSTLNQYA